MLALLKNIPKIVYYTTTRETSQVKRKETLIKLVIVDKGPDFKNVSISNKCIVKCGIM